MRLIAQERAIPFDGEAVLEAICVSYHTALSSNESETALLAANAKFDRIHDFIARESIPYARDLERFTEAGEFRHVVFDAKSKPQEILRPAMDRADALASAIGEAIRTSPRARVVLRFEGASDARSAIRDVALRTRLGSSGSQGLNKLLVLMNRPIRGVDHDVILYLKQQIPSAAQRNRVTRETPQSPAQRVCDSGDRLASPRLFLNVPCRVDGESYQMTLKEPWSDELDTADVKTAPDLVVAARVWGVVAGTAHREASPQRQAIPQRLTSDLRDQIRARGDEFAAKLASDFAASCSDPRVTAHAAAADQAITEFVRNATTHNERVWEGKQR
jgi:hypothetical protein